MNATLRLVFLVSTLALCSVAAHAEDIKPAAPISVPEIDAAAPAPTLAPAPAPAPAFIGAVVPRDPPKASTPGALSSFVQAFLRTSSEGARDANLECMAKVIYHEARDQNLISQLAVAEVIANRTHSSRFPKTLCSVANQPGQFFAVDAYKVPLASLKWRTALAIAKMAQDQARPLVTAGALFYHSAAVTPAWSHKRIKVAEIGGNVFYR